VTRNTLNTELWCTRQKWMEPDKETSSVPRIFQCGVHPWSERYSEGGLQVCRKPAIARVELLRWEHTPLLTSWCISTSGGMLYAPRMGGSSYSTSHGLSRHLYGISFCWSLVWPLVLTTTKVQTNPLMVHHWKQHYTCSLQYTKVEDIWKKRLQLALSHCTQGGLLCVSVSNRQ